MVGNAYQEDALVIGRNIKERYLTFFMPGKNITNLETKVQLLCLIRYFSP
jgi:hypothetical protein